MNCCETKKILSGFKNFEIGDKALIDSFTKPWKLDCSDLSFANMFIWGVDGKMQYTIEDDVLYVKLEFKGFPVFLWPPIPNREKEFDYKALIERAFDYLESRGEKPQIRNIWLPFKKMIEEVMPEAEFIPAEDTWDYVYSREKLAYLKGKKLHGKRNHINKFLQEHPDYVYKRIDPSMHEECLSVYDEWKEEKNLSENAFRNERRSVVMALENMEALGLVGGAILLEGKIKAFTIGERIRSDVQLIHIEKADADINGLFPMINQQYVLNECEDALFINREEDMGVEGMRKAKRSYRPDYMVEKYRITKK